MQRDKLLLAVGLVTIAITIAGGTERDTGAAAVDAKAAFAQLKQLEGVWEAPAAGGKMARTEFEVTANGTVLLERYTNASMPGGGRMATAYHLEGNDLVLTHYCIAKNQPRLVATKIAPDGRGATFEFLDGTGMTSRDAGHMDKVVYDFTDADHYTSRWTWYSKGEERWLEQIEHERVR